MTNHPPSSILHPRRILVRGTNWLGDAVMTTPALLRLREKFPGAHIALLTPDKLRGLWLNHPAKVFSASPESCDGGARLPASRAWRLKMWR
jgi:heptosyltransferase-2